ncbi:hypothetical protein [Clostridium thermobutyricum]|uniref:hypothetical protein n=1 Tax=Clostridium thermobutyricum TaxID=29372 RepID=UPI0029426470|nr:hypothetical protein [Clostridium thermobutyricum]
MADNTTSVPTLNSPQSLSQVNTGLKQAEENMDQFAPTFWQNSLIISYSEQSFLPLVTKRPPEIVGNQMIYNRVGEVNVQETTTKEFTGTFTPDATSFGNSVIVYYDQVAIWNFLIPTIMQVQTNANLFGAKMTEAQISLDSKISGNVLKGMYESAGTNLGVIDLNPANIYSVISNMARALNWAKVPQTDRFLLVDWDVWEIIQNDPIFRTTGPMQQTGFLLSRSRKYGSKKIIGAQILGFNVIPNGFLPYTPATASTNATGAMIAVHGDAYAYDMQADIPQYKEGEYGNFNNGMQGLVLYGHGVLRPEGIVSAAVNISLTIPEGVQEVIDV